MCLAMRFFVFGSAGGMGVADGPPIKVHGQLFKMTPTKVKGHPYPEVNLPLHVASTFGQMNPEKSAISALLGSKVMPKCPMATNFGKRNPCSEHNKVSTWPVAPK